MSQYFRHFFLFLDCPSSKCRKPHITNILKLIFRRFLGESCSKIIVLAESIGIVGTLIIIFGVSFMNKFSFRSLLDNKRHMLVMENRTNDNLYFANIEISEDRVQRF
jgi:hypothetical protein